MIHRWKKFSVKEKLIFLLVFAILLPTVFLLVGQYFALLELRDKTRAAFENDLRQNFVEIETETETRLLEKAENALRDFPEIDVETWNSAEIKAHFGKILAANADADSVFIFHNDKKKFSLAEDSRERGFREVKAVENPGEAIDSLGEDDFVIPFFTALQSSNRLRPVGRYFIGQRRCEDCAATGQPPNESLYLYRVFSDFSDISRISVIGIRVNKNYLVKDFLSPVIGEIAARSVANSEARKVFAVFNEQNETLYTNAPNAENAERFEVKSAFGRAFPLWTLAGSFRDNKIEDLSNLYFARGLAATLLTFCLPLLGIFLLLLVAGREVELAKAKSAFVSNVSHELKTPLALIRLFAETLQSGRVKSAEKTHEYYRIISNETRRLTMLIDNILDFSAIEAGRKKYNFAPCDLAEVVAEVVQNYAYSLETAGFTVETDFAENLPTVSVDCDAISQAVLNLLNNAAKYSADEKYIRVSVKQKNGNLAVEVTDHGIGIAPDEQEKIFEDFYRVGGSSDVHNVKGSGLGLSLVKYITEAHNGKVTVSSVVNRGSTFTILLPVINSKTEREKL